MKVSMKIKGKKGGRAYYTQVHAFRSSYSALKKNSSLKQPDYKYTQFCSHDKVCLCRVSYKHRTHFKCKYLRV